MLKKQLIIKLIFSQLLILGIHISLDAQNNRFGIGVAAGVNLSQIDGDKHQGYDKVGLSVGLNGIVNLKKNFNLGIELGYSQRGSKSGEIDRSRIVFGIHPFNLQLNYAEVTLSPNFFFYETYDDYYKFRLAIGISYARLISASVEETPLYSGFFQEAPIIYSDLIDDFAKNDINSVLGLTFYINEHIGIELRHGFGLKPIYQEQNSRFIVYYLSLRGNYTF